MELLVIRHGQSEADVLKRMEGRADFPLTELGLAQAERLADWIARNYPPDDILSSPLKRAAKTAEIIGRRCGVPVMLDEDLMEYNNGMLAGMPVEEAAFRYPVPPEYKKAYIRYYGQETMIEFRTRGETALARIIHEYPQDSRVAIVSHGGMINMLFRSFLRLPVDTNCSIGSGDTAAHLWSLDGEKRSIRFLNSQRHLSLP
jgi:2,3-bisphosphoglycerate-dependent phosphoglycerate mutase